MKLFNQDGRPVIQAVSYVRVSSRAQQEDRLSLQDQQIAIDEYAKANGIEILERYAEGKSAGEDKQRPVFDDMVHQCLRGGPVTLILVHSFSRFYRDQIAFCVIERKLNRKNVKIVSITQHIEDSLARRVVMISDELYRDELSKHSLRTLYRNAQNGNHNGRAPYGYFLEEADAPAGYKGKPRKRLAIHPPEADVVRELFELATGMRGMKPMGSHRLCQLLNNRGTLMRGRPWRRDKIVATLNNASYKGVRYWGRTSAKTKKERPVDSWILVPCPPIVDAELFDKCQALMGARAVRIERKASTNVQALLVGPMVCGQCGAKFWTATSNSGTKRHYRCKTKGIPERRCNSRILPMDAVDQLVLGALVDEIVTPARLMLILERLRNTARSSGSTLSQKRARLASASERLDRLYEVAASGSVDSILKNKLKRAQADRETAALEVKQEEQLIEGMFGKHTSIEAIQAFCLKLRRDIMDLSVEQKRAFVHLYVDSIIVQPDELILTGSGEALLGGAFSQMESTMASPNPWREFTTVAAQLGLASKPYGAKGSGDKPKYLRAYDQEPPTLGLDAFPENWIYRAGLTDPVVVGRGGTFSWTTSDVTKQLLQPQPTPKRLRDVSPSDLR